MIRWLVAKKVKVHIGCGTLYKEGWVNIDNNSDNNIARLDINHDLATGLPFANDEVDFIYHEHFIEHLTYEDGLIFMQECFRVLKPSGVMRIACPDLDILIDSYTNNTWREQEWVTKYGCEWIESRCHMLNVCMTYWGHKFIYNKEELRRRLIQAGFDAAHINEQKY
ncbi:MAG TPA: methyltransferase domain-containing protein, partial [Aquella sp.]|nr:methyltransferase domain-containing protein [Aquella sp.]